MARWSHRLVVLAGLVAGVALGQKCKLSTTITKAPGVLVDRSPQTDGATYDASTDCHWKITTMSSNKVVQLDIDLLELNMDMHNDVLLVNLGVDSPVPQGWSHYTRSTDLMGQDYVGTFDYTATVPEACTSLQGSSFDPMTCSLTDGSLMTDRRRDSSWIYFTGSGDGSYPITLLSMAPDVYIIFRSFAKMSPPSDPAEEVSGLRIAYSFVSAYCDGVTVLAPRLDATDSNSISTELQIKDNMAGVTKPNMNCSWVIQPYRTPDGSTARLPFDSIWLDFRTFDVKGRSIVSIYDGTSSNAPLLAQFVESNGPQDTIKAPRSAVFVTYFTDDGPPSEGFTLGWKALYCPNACSGPSHGTCVLGACDCNKGWDGAACNIPEGWLCAAAHYNSGDGCDCGCGLYDPDCGALDPSVVACTRSKASSTSLYDGAQGRLFSGDCAYCPLPPFISEQPKLPNVNWDGNALEQSCPDVFQCPPGTQCSPTGICTKVADSAPPDVTLRRQCQTSSDCPDATVCSAHQICEAPANYALRLTSDTTADVCSIYGISTTPDFTVELRLQVLTPQGSDVILSYPGLVIERSSALTITVGTSAPWTANLNVADGLWHSIVWSWDNAAGSMSLYEVSASDVATLVATTSSLSPGVVLIPNQNLTLGPMDGAISYMRLWREVRAPSSFFHPSADRAHLVAEYRFMEGSSRDLSANQNDLTTPNLVFGSFLPTPYACVASPFDIPNGLAVGAVVSVSATSTRPWTIGVFGAGHEDVLAVTGTTNLVDVSVDGISAATMTITGVTARTLLIRLQRTSSTQVEVCVNDVNCASVTMSSTAMAYVTVNASPYTDTTAGLQSPCLVHVESLVALAPIVSAPTATTDNAACVFPFAMSVRNCAQFSTYLADKSYDSATFAPLAEAYALAQLDNVDEECQCDDMPTWSTSFDITQVDSATPTVTATIEYVKIKTRTTDPGGAVQCAATCYMVETPGHRRLAGTPPPPPPPGPPGPTPPPTAPPPGPPGPTATPVPTYASGNLARQYNMKRDFVFVESGGSWTVQSASAVGVVASSKCLVTGPDEALVVQAVTAFSCQTIGSTTIDAAAPLPYCIVDNVKKTCQSDRDGCSLPNGTTTLTTLHGAISDNYKVSVTAGVHVCAFNVQPTVPASLRRFANLTYTIQTADLSAADALHVTDSSARPLTPAISGPVAFADLPTKAVVPGLDAKFTLRTSGDKTSNTNDGFVVEYDTVYSFPDAATAHFCSAVQANVTVSDATVFPTTSLSSAALFPALPECSYVLQAPSGYSSIWLEFLDFSMASTSDRIELYDADTSPPTLLTSFTNMTFATPHYGVVFSGQADYIVSAYPLSGQPRTVAFWIQVALTVKKDCSVASACTNNVAKKMKVAGTEFKSTSACARLNVELDVETGFLSMFLNGATHVLEQDVRQGTWFHVAFVYREQDNVMYGYVNGARVAMSAATGVYNPSLPPCSSDVFFLGGQPSLPDDRNVYFNGMLRQVALYSEPKTIYEVGRLMGRTCDTTDSTLLLCYAFSTTESANAIDDSSFELHGRFHGTTFNTQTPLQLSSLLHKTFTSASATLVVKYLPTSPNSTFRVVATPKTCPSCGSHGSCRRGQCHCHVGYTGASCDTKVDACPPSLLLSSKKGVLYFPTNTPIGNNFVPSVPTGGYPAQLDCSWRLRKSSSKIVLTFTKLDLDTSDSIAVYEGSRESPWYLAANNLTADVAMNSASFFSRGQFGYSQVIFKNVSTYDATAVLWPVEAARQPGNCSKNFHIVKFRRGMACADGTPVGLDRSRAAQLVASYWWLESPEAFATQITPLRLVFNDYTDDAARVTVEYTKLLLGQGRVTRPHPAIFRFRRRTQPFTTCEDGTSEGLDTKTLVETTGMHKFTRPDASVGYRQAHIVSPVFRYAGTWSIDPTKPFSGLFRSAGYLQQVGSSPFTVVVRATVVLSSEVQYLFAQEDNRASSMFLRISESRRGLGKWTFGAYGTNERAASASPASFSRDTIMLAISYSYGVINYYVNGVLFGTHDTYAAYQACIDQCNLEGTDGEWECRNQEPIHSFDDASRVVMGGRLQGGAVFNAWKGQILEFSVYDKALPDAVVASLHTGVDAISTTVTKFSVNSFGGPTQGEASTIEVVTVPVGATQLQASSTLIRKWQVNRYACAAPDSSLDASRLTTILNASSAFTKVVYNAMDDTAALISWSTATSALVQTSLVRSKQYGHSLTTNEIVDLLVQYGVANDNYPYVVTAVYVTAISPTSASVGFRFVDAQQLPVEATTTLSRVNNTWRPPAHVHRLIVPLYGVLPPTKCRDDRNSTVPLTDTSGVLSDGGSTESSIVVPNTHCSWLLRAPAGETITISFTYFFVSCAEGEVTIDDLDAQASTPVCGQMAGWSGTFGPNVRLIYRVGPPPTGPNNHPLPMASTGFFGQYVFSNDNPVLDTVEVPVTYGPWTVVEEATGRPASTKCQVDASDESPSYEWKIQESWVQSSLDETCYQPQANDADFEWEVESFDAAAGDTITCKDNNWQVDDSVPWSAVSIDRVGGTERYTDAPTTVFQPPAFTYTKANQSKAATYISERNALEIRVQSSAGGRGRAVIEYYMPQTFYVAPASYQSVDGSDGDGSREKPFTHSFAYLVANILASGDMIRLYPGRYEGTGYCNLILTSPIVIESISGPRWTVLDCNGASRGWQLKHASGLTIVKGITFTRTTVSSSPFTGAAMLASGDVHIESCVFESNVHRAQGTLAIVSPSVSTVVNCSFSSNSGISGPAIAVLSATATLDSIQVVDNYATLSGALFVSTYVEGTTMSLSSPSRVSVTNSSFVRNRGLKEGAMTISRASVVEVSNSQFTATSGVAIAVDASTLKFDRNVVQGNLGSGIVATTAAVVTATDSTFASNSAKNGPAVSLDSSSFQGRGNTYQGNTATVAGGAVYGQGCQYSEVDSSFVSNGVGNASNAIGGGALAFASCNNAVDSSIFQVVVQRCTLQNNSATFGGAIHFRDVHAALLSNRLVGNAAGRFGGAVRVANCVAQRDEVVLDLRNNSFEANTAARGAAVYAEASDGVQFVSNMFLGNAASSFGGAIALVTVTRVQIVSSTFQGCVASGGGAIYTTSETTLDIVNSLFTECSSRSNGGSLYVENTQLSLTHVAVQGGMASRNGGAIVLMSQGTSIRAANLTITSTTADKGGAFYLIDCSILAGQVSDVRIVNTSAVKMGGAFYAVLVTMELSHLTTIDTSAESGGMMTLEDSTATLMHSSVSASKARRNGGAFYVIISELAVVSSSIETNQATNYGGSVYGFASAVTISDSSLRQSTSEFGGGVYVSSSTLEIVRSTITANVADTGGALYADLSDVSVNDSAFDANAAATSGGVAFVSNNNVDLANSTFTNNLANQGGALSLSDVTRLTVDASSFVNNSVTNSATTTLRLLGGAIFMERIEENSTLSSCIFLNNSADEHGGAIYASNAAASSALNAPTLVVASSVFRANGAGLSGGAVFLDSLRTAFQSSSFTANFGRRGGGGAIFWQGSAEPDGLPGQTYVANSAEYGSNFASVAVALRPMYIPPPSGVVGQPGGEGSAQPFVGSFTVHIVDKYMQTVATENTVQVALESNTANAFVTGTSKVTAHNGVANFTKAGVQQMPGSNATVAVSASGLVALSTVELHIRQCVRGEVTPVGVPQCVKCPFGQFSWNTSDTVCHQCPVGGVCGGGDNIEVLDGYWRFENSTGVCTDPSYPYDGCRLGTCLDKSCNGFTKGDVTATVRLDGPNDTMILTIRSDTIGYQPNDTLYVQGEELRVVSTEKIGDGTSSFQHQVVVTGNVLSTTGAVDIYVRGTEKCKPGYTGNLCFQCAPGYTRSGKTACTACPASLTLTVTVLVLGVFGVGAVAIVLIVMTINKSRQKADLYSILSKIFTSYLQLVSLAGSFDMQWPQQVKAMFAGQGQISNPGDKLISIECLMDHYKRTMDATPLTTLSNYYMQLIVFLLLPVCAVVFPLIFWRLRFRLASRRIRHRDWGIALNSVLGRGTGSDVMIQDDELSDVLVAVKETPSDIVLDYVRSISKIADGPQPLSVVKASFLQATRDEMRDKTVLSIIVLMFLVHPGLSNQIFQMYTCTELGYDAAGNRLFYLNPDLDVQCYDATHYKWMYFVGIPALVLYTLGIPYFAFHQLRTRRHELDQPRTKLQFGFLYDGYKLEHYYWEIWIMMRKIIVAFISVFLKNWGTAPQALGASGLVFFALWGHMETWPYEADCVNALEQKALLACLFTLYCGLYLLQPEVTNVTRVVIGALIITANGLFLVFFGRLMIVQVKQKAQHALGQLSKQKYVTMAVSKIRKTSVGTSKKSLRSVREQVVAPDLSTEHEVQHKLDKTDI